MGERFLPKESDHGRILAAAAQKSLKPLGFWQKGRSRVWLADRWFWLSVVEFQPSSFSKGSYLNVAAHWLWRPTDTLSFDYFIDQSKPWIDFHSSTQFAPLAEQLAEQAAQRSRGLEAEISDISAAAALLVAKHTDFENAGRGGAWPAFDAAIASGLNSDMVVAQTLLRRAYDTIGEWRPDLQTLLVPYLEAVGERTAFTTFIGQKINEQRSLYALSPFDLTAMV